MRKRPVFTLRELMYVLALLAVATAAAFRVATWHHARECAVLRDRVMLRTTIYTSPHYTLDILENDPLAPDGCMDSYYGTHADFFREALDAKDSRTDPH